MSAVLPRHELDDGIDGGRQLEEVVPRLGSLASQARPADMGLATPCAEWTTRDLLTGRRERAGATSPSAETKETT